MAHPPDGPIGEEIELDHPYDPILVLSRHGSDESSNSIPEKKRVIKNRRRVSFFSSPLNSDIKKSIEKAPMVKIIHTSRGDMNGKYGYVHAYYHTRERYAVTLLEGEARHPALVYFGVLGAEDIKNSKAANEDHQQKNEDRRWCPNQTIFLPPTAVAHLGHLDIASLFLQYVALHIFARPHLTRRIEHMMDMIQNQLLPVMKLENFSMFFLLILPLSVASLYNLLLDRWKTSLSVSDFIGVNPVTLILPSHLIGYMTDLPSRVNGYMNDLPSHMIAFMTDHLGEVLTLSSLFVGTSTIARFILFEYRLVKDKAEAMISGQSREIQKKIKSLSAMEMFEYRIDYYFSTSKWAKVALLLGFTFLLIAAGAGSLVVLMDDHSISNAVWVSWTYVADPGTHADCPDSFPIRIISITVTLGGMLIFALMIGIISDYIAEKVDDLKKGKSRIIDINHTVMLGWTDKSLSIIQQVALANESEGGGTIVVLATKDKQEMEETLASAVVSSENPLRLLGTEVIFRSGNPLLESELRRVSTQTARCVMSLSMEELDPDEADSTQVRQVMALKAFDEFLGSQCHVVVEVQDIDNEELFPLVAPDFAEVVVTHDIIGRLMIQCARCPGLASVLEAMMGFEGSEFYFEEWPQLAGQTFHEITCRFDEAVPIGVKSSIDGQVYINPENDYVINEGDKVLVLAEDNDSYEVNDGGYEEREVGYVPNLLIEKKKVERIMFCGWRRDLADMIKQLDDYVERGSELWLFNLVPAKQRATLLQDKGNKDDLHLENLNICNVVGNPVIRRDLNNIQAVDNSGRLTGQTITLDQFDSILILADAVAIENGANMMSCDSRSLSSLLIIQDIQKKIYEERKKKYPETKVPCSPISEILDSRTKSLLSVANCKGYIMSNQIISSVVAQVSEDKDINTVLREILTAEGSETYIRSISRFVNLKKESEMSFWDIALRARQLREVAIGYKPEGMDFIEAEDLIINPPYKSVKRKWSPGDIVVTFSLD